MNRHFQRDYPSDWQMPDKAYARLDHVELPAPGKQTVLLAFDAVDAQWLVDRGRIDERFDLTAPDRALAALSARPLKPLPRGQGGSPFEDAPLYRIEIEKAKHAAPTLYYDLGAGVYRNQHTTPSNLVFCFTHSPPILLSHWDADHWAGTYANSVGGTYPALLRDWYAPMQTVGPVHTAFA